MPCDLGLPDLHPPQARLCLKAEAFIRSLVPGGFEGRPIILALSGGIDSAALAVILKALSPRLGSAVVAAHMDHALREESASDAKACALLCDRLGIGFRAARRDVAALAATWGTGIEDAGRRARYAWLEEIRQEADGFCVATAHQLDDLAEDQLMRLIRGAGWPALGGMPAWDGKRRILRPLLMTPKADLEELLRAAGVPWREDHTNKDPAYMRNRVRQDILPLFVRENPDYLAAAAELWRQARLDAIHWNDAVLEAKLHPLGDDAGCFISDEALKGASQALRLRLYKRAVESLGPGQPLSAALHGLDEAWRNRSTGKRFQFPGGKEARVERGGISFHPGQPAPRR
ncbi:MAG: tRNA lysidine(34) synthetase TilS [Thermodesulfobacteriota bacterium]